MWPHSKILKIALKGKNGKCSVLKDNIVNEEENYLNIIKLL